MTGFRVAYLLACAVPTLTLTAAAAAAPPEWTVSQQTLPADADGWAYVHGYSCSRPNHCVSVGPYSTGDPSLPTRAYLNTVAGNNQTPVAAPLPANAVTGPDDAPGLSDVSCAVGGQCVAVGNYPAEGGHLPLVETQNSSGGWTPQTVVVPGTHRGPYYALTDVDCGGSDCAAIGVGGGSSVPVFVTRTASGWSAPTVSTPAGYTLNSVEGVACSTTGPCFAFGRLYPTGAGPTPMAFLYPSGSGYKAVPFPLPPGADSYITLVAMACSAGPNCVAIGSYDDYHKVVAETLADGVLTAVPVALPHGIAIDPPVVPRAVSCNRTGTCAATAIYGVDDPQLGIPNDGGVLLVRAGGAWTAQRAPKPQNKSDAAPDLRSVSCDEGGKCVAVGITYPSRQARGALAETYVGGTWRARDLGLPPFALGADDANVLRHVACVRRSCTAVGEDTTYGSPYDPPLREVSYLATVDLGP